MSATGIIDHIVRPHVSAVSMRQRTLLLSWRGAVLLMLVLMLLMLVLWRPLAPIPPDVLNQHSPISSSGRQAMAAAACARRYPLPSACPDWPYKDDLLWLQDPNQAFEWLGKRRDPATQYEQPLHHRPEGFRLKGADGKLYEYREGSFCSLSFENDPTSPGDISSNHIAKILAILEDGRGHCWLAVHYFWRWGQVHSGADVLGAEQGFPRACAPLEAELILQAERVTANDFNDAHGRNAVFKDPNGTYRELVSAANLDRAVTVLSYRQVRQSYPHLPEAEALAAYDADHPEKEEPREDDPEIKKRFCCRRDFFFWRYVHDHTAYAFPADPVAVWGPSPALQLPLRLPPAGLKVLDICGGQGTVAVAARTAGFDVLGGVDTSAQAISSFLVNTSDSLHGGPFNPSGRPAKALHCSMQQLLDRCASSSTAAAEFKANWLHFSPPCQEMSNAKQKKYKRFTGATLMAIPQLVEVLQPEFVTVEEVEGFIVHSFPPEGMLVWDECGRQQKRRERQRRQQQRQQQGSSAAGGSSTAGPSGESEGAGTFDDGDDAGDDAEEGSNDQDDEGEEAGGEDAATEAALRATDRSGEEADKGVFRPFLLVVPQLLSLGYQVRMCLLNSAEYGVPQHRWRIVLFAAKIGYELPRPPPPRYQLPQGKSRVLVTADNCFLYKNGSAASWWDVLRAEAHAAIEAVDGQLLPHVTIAEAVGDLPPVLSDGSSGSSGGGGVWQQEQEGGCSWHLEQGWQQGDGQAAAAGGAGGGGNGSTHTPQAGAGDDADDGQQQQQDDGDDECEQQQQQLPPAPPQQPTPLQQRLASIRSAGEAARRASSTKPRSRDSDGALWGRPAAEYNPRQGVLLCQLLPGSGVAGLQPISAYAQYCRSPHWPGQVLTGRFNPLLLHDHTVSGVEAKLTCNPARTMHPLGVVGTVVGKNVESSSSQHFAESRNLTHRKRNRLQGIPDFLQQEGVPRSASQQVGNAVPYLMAVEIAASVFLAATGTDGQRPPRLVGPSPDGWGLTASELPRYRAWWRDTQPYDAIMGSRAALAAQLGLEAPAGAAEAAAASDAGGGGGGSGGGDGGGGGGGGGGVGSNTSQQQQQPGGGGGAGSSAATKSKKKARSQQQQQQQQQKAAGPQRRSKAGSTRSHPYKA